VDKPSPGTVSSTQVRVSSTRVRVSSTQVRVSSAQVRVSSLAARKPETTKPARPVNHPNAQPGARRNLGKRTVNPSPEAV
jgi:hypothetical protein